MKKLFFVAAMAIFAFGAISCKKDYTCECKGDGYEYKVQLTESKKAAAAAVCEGKGIGSIKDEDGESLEDDSETCTLSK